MSIRRNVCFLVIFISILSSPNSFSSYRASFTVMTYNIENLFDSLHDEGTNDYTFLPLERKETDMEVRRYCASIRVPYYRKMCFELDWNPNVVMNKIQNVARVIREADFGRSPDIVVFQEIENMNILRKLIRYGLEDEGYEELILVEGPDKRGIDVAIISKIPLDGDIKYHEIDLTDAYEPGEKVKLTRGILEATFKLKGKKFKVLANHWPSQSNDDETRMIAGRLLKRISMNSKIPAISMGDFNTEDRDVKNPIRDILLNRSSNLPFFDFESVYFDNFGSEGDHRGTHFYRNKWSSLDKIFLPRAHTNSECRLQVSCLRPVWESYKVIKMDFMMERESYTSSAQNSHTKEFEKPKRFDPLTGTGVSDHLPVVGRFTF